MTIELVASYRLIDDLHASLVLESDQNAGITMSLLHERFQGDAACYDFTGHVHEALDLVAGESLTVIVRCQGRIIASLVNEVDCRDGSRLLLHPKGGFALLIHQVRLEDLPAPLEARHQGTFSVRLLREPTPATLLISELLEAIRAYYASLDRPLSQDFKRIWPAMEQAVELNEETHSREMLGHLCTVLEETLEISSIPQIQNLYNAALATIR